MCFPGIEKTVQFSLSFLYIINFKPPMWVLKLLTLINWSWSSQYLRDLNISKNDSWCLKFEETDFHVFCNLYLRVKVLIMLPRGESKMMKIVLKFRNTQLLKFPFSFQFYGKYVRSSFLFIDSIMALERLFTWYFWAINNNFSSTPHPNILKILKCSRIFHVTLPMKFGKHMDQHFQMAVIYLLIGLI